MTIVAITGMVGVGKTELALQYTLRYLENYQGGICWTFGREFDVGVQIVSFAQAHLGLKLPDELELRDQVAYCWRHWSEGEVLLVLNDVADFSQVKPYLPPHLSRFKVLMTTRLRLGSPIVQLYLDVLRPEEALQLLRSLIGAERLQQEQEIANVLCEWLGYLPLGIELVGRYLNETPDLSLSVLLFRLQEKAKKNQALKHTSLVRDPDDPTWTLTAQRGIEAAFDLSWEGLNDQTKYTSP